MRISSLLLVLASAGCGSRSIEPPLVAHPSGDGSPVPYPPPPAKVEEVPPRPAPECIWTDGFWEFTDRWEWRAGEWVVPPARCGLAPVTLERRGGQLWHRRPRWYPESAARQGAAPACALPRPCSVSPRTP